MVDFTTLAANPAARIQAHYSDLMSTPCVDTLRAKALTIIELGGVSATNAARFKSAVAGQTTEAGLKKYLTNFMLAGAGLSVIGGKPGGR